MHFCTLPPVSGMLLAVIVEQVLKCMSWCSDREEGCLDQCLGSLWTLLICFLQVWGLHLPSVRLYHESIKSGQSPQSRSPVNCSVGPEGIQMHQMHWWAAGMMLWQAEVVKGWKPTSWEGCGLLWLIWDVDSSKSLSAMHSSGSCYWKWKLFFNYYYS